jgi:hypothetical protein
MESWGTPIKEFFDELRNCSTSGPVFGQLGNLLWGGDFSSQQEPKETLRQWLATTGSLWKELLAIRNCLAPETNSLIWKQ